MEEIKPYTVITGSSKGIGKILALEYAKHGHNLILVARSSQILSDLKNDLESRFSVSVKTFICDLSNLEDVEKVFTEISNYEINCLINNAGIGIFTKVEAINQEDVKKQMNVNLLAPMLSTKILLSNILKNQGSVINICSVLSFIPNAKASIYIAGKSGLYAFSNTLRLEYPNLHVLTVHPITVETSFFTDPNYLNNVKKKLSPDTVARKVYQAYKKKKRRLNIPKSIFWLNLIYQICPGLIDRLNRKYFSYK
ncbi:MAG: SDR family NAD(P)-dependent oxidoreductase [Bacilli bacterium]|nr:SDR family NAD(P)-dependent oxidoreductase [Bacilli bacterium]